MDRWTKKQSITVYWWGRRSHPPIAHVHMWRPTSLDRSRMNCCCKPHTPVEGECPPPPKAWATTAVAKPWRCVTPALEPCRGIASYWGEARCQSRKGAMMDHVKAATPVKPVAEADPGRPQHSPVAHSYHTDSADSVALLCLAQVCPDSAPSEVACLRNAVA